MMLTINLWSGNEVNLHRFILPTKLLIQNCSLGTGTWRIHFLTLMSDYSDLVKYLNWGITNNHYLYQSHRTGERVAAAGLYAEVDADGQEAGRRVILYLGSTFPPTETGVGFKYLREPNLVDHLLYSPLKS